VIAEEPPSFERDSADGTVIARGTNTGTVRLHEAGSGYLIAVLSPHTDQVLALTFGRADDTDVLVPAGADNTVRTWAARTGIPLMFLHGHTDALSGAAVAIAPPGQDTLIASGAVL
jgi:WD40 repeat protein